MASLFRDRIADAAKEKKSSIVLAIDPSPSINDVLGFVEKAIADTQDHICAIKLNFHAILPLSGKELASIIHRANSAGLQCLADIKLNDIENTNQVTLEHLVGRMGFDCVIANPFVGRDALESMVKKAQGLGGGIIALVYMSHKGATEGYGLQMQGNRRLYEVFRERAADAGADGIVVGAGNLDILRELSGQELPIYSPGIGAQGADAIEVARSGADYLIVGRSIIESSDPAGAAKALKSQLLSAARG
jgi:orotidine-5'-phosphate decarboxylase